MGKTEAHRGRVSQGHPAVSGNTSPGLQPHLVLGFGWVGGILRVELAPSLAADPEQGTGVGIEDRAKRSCCWMGSFHPDQENL